MIEVQSISKHFGAQQVLRDLTFHAADGQITALLGANGAGKTSCLRIITGLLRADSGTVRVGKIDVAAQPLAVRRQLGVVGDREGLYERLTVKEYLTLFARMQGLTGERLRQSLDEVRGALELEDLWLRRTRGFSQGERMKVSLARALVHRPQHLILDEPTRGLDVLAARLLRRTLLRLRNEGTAILFSSHVMSEVLELSDRVLVMAEGRVVGAGGPQALMREAHCDNLEDAFVSLAYGSQREQVEGEPA
ncbi:ATP-binding cassette domain-containing protein [Microbulbifer yueqingensis]|uniref:Sodium transport system ATP-binding protein n=1 Tax=Microbulbifer yueqingensis TaxID=658219 RepID=A0A1G9F2L1_9GAMM|nr:ATP-binding cassette domain-containing protein [Microbulbifer yueqingensis]SDK82560.1 sodium transport system ATP-binding protein [Microbulbifer yueqingensis]